MRKIINKLCAMFLVISCAVTIIPTPVFASYDAQVKFVQESIKSLKSKDVDYSFETNGGIISGIQLSSTEKTDVEVSYKMIVDNVEYESGTFTNKVTAKLQDYQFAEGKKIVIRLRNIKGASSVNKLYCEINKYPLSEKENNNTKAKANSLGLEKNGRFVSLCMKDDEDWFIFEAPEAGKYNINISSGNSADSNSEDSIMVDMDSLNKTWVRKQRTSGKKGGISYKAPFKKGQTVYIKISSAENHSVQYRVWVEKV